MTADPRILYRGYLPNCGNMGLCTGFQFLVNGAVKKMFTGGVSRSLSAFEQVRACQASSTVVSLFMLLVAADQRRFHRRRG